eukprot:201829_1
MDILRRQCMGSEPISFQIISREEELFSDYKNHPYANYRDPFYSVGTPVFSIHGNHDDPVREVGANETELPLATLDILHKANLLTYIGKSHEVDRIKVSPLILKKGTTTLALYALGNVRDERLTRMWQEHKLTFLHSEEEEGGGGQVNLFVLHQNREQRGKGRNYIKDQMIPHWMDLVIWGHEHEARGELEESFTGNFHVIQPGSTVATSLVPGEAKQKQVVVLHIRGYEFNPRFVNLTQVRPFHYEEVKLRELGLDPNDHKVDEAVTKKLNNIVKQRIRSIQEMDAQRGITVPPNMDYPLSRRDQVLIRLSIDHTGFQTLHNQWFGSSFVGQVANPTDMLLFKRTANQRNGTSRGAGGGQHGSSGMAAIPPDSDITVSELVLENLLTADKKLELVSEHALQEALEKYVDQQEAQAIAEEVQSTLERRQIQMKELDDFVEDITEAKVKAFTEEEKEKEKAERVQQKPLGNMFSRSHIEDDDDEDDFSDEELATTTLCRNATTNKLTPDQEPTLLTPSDSVRKKTNAYTSKKRHSVTSEKHEDDGAAIVNRRGKRKKTTNKDPSGEEELLQQHGKGKLENYCDVEEVQNSSDEDNIRCTSAWNKSKKPLKMTEKVVDHHRTLSSCTTATMNTTKSTTPAKKKRRMLPTYLQGPSGHRSLRDLSSHQKQKKLHSEGTDYVRKWGSLS